MDPDAPGIRLSLDLFEQTVRTEEIDLNQDGRYLPGPQGLSATFRHFLKVIKQTGFMKGLYTEAEMNSDNVKVRSSAGANGVRLVTSHVRMFH